MVSPTINELVADDTILHTLNLMRADAGVRRSILKIIRKLDADLVALVQRSKLTEFGKRRVAALQQIADALIQSAYREVTEEMEKSMFGIASAEGRQAVKGINGAVGVDLATVYIAPATLQNLATNAMIEGAPSAVWWARQARAVQNRFIDTVRMGLLQGLPTQTITRNVMNNVFPWERRNADALVRTSVQQVANDVRLKTYEYNRSVVKGVKTLVTFDGKTTKLCMSRSPMAWYLDGKPMNAATTYEFPGPPPWHWNCRTTLTAVLKSWGELGSHKKIKEIEPGLRSSMDGAVPEELSYEEWLKTKSAEFQREKLGKYRYEKFAKGELKLSDLVDQTGNELTIPELEALTK